MLAIVLGLVGGFLLAAAGAAPTEAGKEIATSVDALYAAHPAQGRTEVVFEIPGDSRGVDVYVFAGPTPREAVQRYNLFSGGGAVPPLWGLGMKYRTFTRADKATAMGVARAMREMKIPCDMFGLEPGWQTQAYSCSLVWSNERFPDHVAMLDELAKDGYRVNLWEHAYIHPSSPLFKPLQNRSGDFLVWGGLVVDFADPEAFKLFADYHARELVSQGISGFKADECDNQPITDCTPFNFPTSTVFPSGIDGEQMLQLYGYYYQRSIFSVFKARNQRTWGDVRATSALAAPLPVHAQTATVSATAEVGDIYNFGDRIALSDRFFLGGPNTLRGFSYRKVGPKDINAEPLGGKTYGFWSAEYTFQIAEPFQIAAFYDGGFLNSGTADFAVGNYEDDIGIDEGVHRRSA